VHSVDLPLFFSLHREDFALTDAFFGHYRELQRIATREVRRQRSCTCAYCCTYHALDAYNCCRLALTPVDLEVPSRNACIATFGHQSVMLSSCG
jgi:hypothetical protein